VRILLLLAVLGMTAACVPPPAPAASAPPTPVALVPPPAAAAPVAVVPVPPPPPPQPVLAVAVPNPLAWLFALPRPVPWLGRVTLSNFTYDDARVQAVITPYADCEVHPGTTSSDFELPLNGTRIIWSQPGKDVCYRRELPPGPQPTGPELISGWTGWSRVFTSAGRPIDSQL
jgi:hypothetical protein